MNFPYANLRDQQKDLINDISSGLSGSKKMLIHAPTGLGKTIGVLYPAMKHAIENDLTVFFLTSRHSQHKIVVDTLQDLRIAGADIRAVDIVGKKSLCSYDVSKMDGTMFNNFCNSMVEGKQCLFYQATKENHELTLRGKEMMYKLKKMSPLHSEQALKMANTSFCTYELLIESAKTSNVIVGDYFHVFSPMYGSFFRKMNKKMEKSIIIVDEAHNLPSRIRNHLSSKMSSRILELAKEEAEKFDLFDTADCIKHIIYAYKKLSQRLQKEKEVFITKNELTDLIEDYIEIEELVSNLNHSGLEILKDKKRSFVESVANFLDNWNSSSEVGYAKILSKERVYDKEQIVIQNNCLDPSIISKPVIEDSYSTIMMSGTLQPLEMYRDTLGFEKDVLVKQYSSPFPKENRLNIIIDNITTLYNERTEENYKKMTRFIETSSMAIKGNVAVFFPSYEILRKINSLMDDRFSKPIIIEKQGMDKKEKAEMYRLFSSYAKTGAVLFGVIGGSFSEGVDLPGELLNGVIILGLPLERPTKQTEALIDYYDKMFSRGRDYGYIFPAAVKVIQAAGRCIRTETDKGVCIFADKRFAWQNYRKLLPEDAVVSSDPEKLLIDFFQK